MTGIIKYYSEDKKESWKLELELKHFGKGECAVCQVEKDLVLAEKLIEENGKSLDNQPIDLKCFKHARFLFRKTNNGWDELYKPFIVAPESYEELKQLQLELRSLEKDLILIWDDRYSPRKHERYYKDKGLFWNSGQNPNKDKDKKI